MSHKPIYVVARRWDRLGARLCAMVNAMSLARLLGVEFRFVWPRGRFRDLDDPAELFAAEYLQRHEIDAGHLDKMRPILATQYATLEALRSASHEAGGGVAILVDEWALPIRFGEQTSEEAAALYRSSFQTFIWSPTIDAVRAQIASLPSDIRVALHIRAGDFVFPIRYGNQAGEDWTNNLPAEKYIATGIFEMFAREAAADGHRILAFSDSEEAIKRIRQAHEDIVTPTDLIPDLENLTEAQRALADILLMARMARIYAPAASAFSRLAATLGDAEMVSVRDTVGKDKALGAIQSFLVKHVAPPRDRDPLLARDACWYLDLFADELSLEKQAQLARLSDAADPRFCHGKNWFALTCALSRDHAGFAQASASALALAQGAQPVHDDPYVETLAVAASSRLLLSLFGDSYDAGIIARLLPRRDLAGPELAALPSLRPNQTHLHDIITNLRFQRLVIRHAARQGMDLAPFIEEILTRPGGLRMPDWRCPGTRTMPDAAAAYPGVLRMIETFTILLATASAQALAGSTTGLVRNGSVEAVTSSPTGLNWARGWISNGWHMGRHRLVGIADAEGRVFWGSTHVLRADLAWKARQPWSLYSGFMVPVLPDLAASSMTLLRVQ